MRKHLHRLAAAGACLIAWSASAASLLPPGMQTFVDANGAPLNGGTLQFYIPNSTTPKDTFQDAGETILNTNPVVLDSSGRAVVYGAGSYREVLKDQLGNIVWDKITGDPGAGSASWGGTGGGTGDAQTVTAANFSSQDGQSISYIPASANDGPASLNPNGVGPIAIVVDTPNGPSALSGGELTANNVATLTYDASRGVLHLTGTPLAQPGAPSAIAAASTVDIGAAASRYVNITGSATINSFGGSCSSTAPIYFVNFQGADTLVNSGTLQIPGGGTYTTSDGDTAIVQCLGSGHARVQSFTTYRQPPGFTVPSGAVLPFYLSACPAGWIAADGTNNTVDMRGMVARGLDSGAGVDPGRGLGTQQADALQAFTVGTPLQNIFNGSQGALNGVSTNGQTTGTSYGVIAGANGATLRTAGETRMKNVALLYCQKS